MHAAEAVRQARPRREAAVSVLETLRARPGADAQFRVPGRERGAPGPGHHLQERADGAAELQPVPRRRVRRERAGVRAVRRGEVRLGRAGGQRARQLERLDRGGVDQRAGLADFKIERLGRPARGGRRERGAAVRPVREGFLRGGRRRVPNARALHVPLGQAAAHVRQPPADVQLLPRQARLARLHDGQAARVERRRRRHQRPVRQLRPHQAAQDPATGRQLRHLRARLRDVLHDTRPRADEADGRRRRRPARLRLLRPARVQHRRLQHPLLGHHRQGSQQPEGRYEDAEGRPERSDGVHQRRYDPGRSRFGERSPGIADHPLDRRGHGRDLPALQRAALQAVAEELSVHVFETRRPVRMGT